MTIKATINGQPFEIEVDDGAEVSFSDGRMTVRAKSTVIHHYIYQQPAVPYSYPAAPIYPLYPQTWPTITCTGEMTVDAITSICATN